eukprot:c15531_g1_i1.p2 GENE.c15531_g1_i1~~c15531_g1_i1.p2  ORF type:complete len:255 (-),score=68.99 c15531_g1_i1:126-890(-)
MGTLDCRVHFRTMESSCLSGQTLLITGGVFFALEKFGDLLMDRVREAVSPAGEDFDMDKETLWMRITNAAHFVKYSVAFIIGLSVIDSFSALALLGAIQPSAGGGHIGIYLAAELGLRLNSIINTLLAIASGGSFPKRVLANVTFYFALFAAAWRGDGSPCWILAAFCLVSRFHLQITNLLLVSELGPLLPAAIIDTAIDGYVVALLARALLGLGSSLGTVGLVAVVALLAKEGINLAMRVKALASGGGEGHMD